MKIVSNACIILVSVLKFILLCIDKINWEAIVKHCYKEVLQVPLIWVQQNLLYEESVCRPCQVMRKHEHFLIFMNTSILHVGCALSYKAVISSWVC